MNTPAYTPAGSISAKIARRVTPFLSRRMLEFSLDRPLISFTFDDCPETALSEGVSRLEDAGWRSTIYVSCGLYGVTNHHGKMASAEAIKAAYDNGHEIGEHSYSHIDATEQSLEGFMSDIDTNQKAFDALGIKANGSMAYPFGQTAPRVKTALAERFEGLRGITPGVHWTRVDLNQIKSYPLYENTADNIAGVMESMGQQPGWLTLFTHDIRNNPSEWGCTPDNMKKVIAAAKNNGAIVLPVAEAIQYLKERAL